VFDLLMLDGQDLRARRGNHSVGAANASVCIATRGGNLSRPTSARAVDYFLGQATSAPALRDSVLRDVVGAHACSLSDLAPV
jgi:hypothetical protein